MLRTPFQQLCDKSLNKIRKSVPKKIPFQDLCNNIKDKIIQTRECVHCGSKDFVKLECSRTAYHWDGIGEDPNKDIPLCRPCADEHHAHWDEMWKEYYSGLL